MSIETCMAPMIDILFHPCVANKPASSVGTFTATSPLEFLPRKTEACLPVLIPEINSSRKSICWRSFRSVFSNLASGSASSMVLETSCDTDCLPVNLCFLLLNFTKISSSKSSASRPFKSNFLVRFPLEINPPACKNAGLHALPCEQNQKPQG